MQRAVGLPECATPPEEVYELAKRRGMDFVTITDHDTIAGALEIADRPDVFVSEELTASFRGEPQAVHVLCYGISPEDHEWLQAHSGDVEACAEYLRERDIVCALAHPYYTVGAPLTVRHRRRLAELFDIWEIRNGARARELNRPAAIYVATREGIGIGGSDDHAGVDIGRTWSETPSARTPGELLAHLRAGRVAARGDQGSAAKWAHSAIALAARALGRGVRDDRSLDPRMVMHLVQRLLREGDVRHGATGEDLAPEDARRLLRTWLAAVELDHLDERGLIAHMQEPDFRHADLYRRACRAHERKLRAAVGAVVSTLAGHPNAADHSAAPRAVDPTGATRQLGAADLADAAAGIFQGCIAAIPYAPAAAFLGNEKAKLDSREGETPRVAILADGIGSTHGVTRTIEELRQRGVPGFEIEVIGTDPEVDRRLSAVAEVEVPFYPGLRIGVPSLTVAVETLAEGRFDAIHVCSPGPVGIAGALVARGLRLPLVGSYHTELTAYAALRSQDAGVAQAMDLAVRSFYGACDLVLSPSPASDEALRQIGVSDGRTARWDRGVDTARFDPSLRGPEGSSEPHGAPSELHSRTGEPHSAPSETHGYGAIDALNSGLHGGGAINVLYAGRITREKGSELLADAFLEAHRQDPRLHLVLAGGGPEQERLRERLGPHATFLGWLEGQELARAYARADIFLFASATDTFGQVILEAQASGVPVVAVARGGPLSLVRARCQRAAVRARRPRARRARGGARGARRCCADACPPPVLPPCASAPGRAPWSASPMATGESSRPSSTRGSAVPHRGTIAVALHDIEPATFERCARIRDWLDDHGIDRVTLLVIPARDLHPLGERSPEMIEWLAECRRRGDAIAQHGFQYKQLRRPSATRRMLGSARGQRSAEFVGLDCEETRRAVEAGWRVLKLAGVEPDGFVAPAYAYTRALRATLTARGTLSVGFRWWAGLLRLHRALTGWSGGPMGASASGAGEKSLQLLAPAWDVGSEGVMRRALSPSLMRAGSLLPGEHLRVDLHPSDLERPRHMMALERVLARAGGRRTAITYSELAASL